MGAFTNTFGRALCQNGKILNYNPATDADVEFWSTSRIGNTLVADVGDNATILAPCLQIPDTNSYLTGQTFVNPVANMVWVFRAKMISSPNSSAIGSITANYKFMLYHYVLSGNQRFIFSWGNTDSGALNLPQLFDWCTIIMYDKRFWVLSSAFNPTDVNILNAIATETPVSNLSTAIFGAGASSGNIRYFLNLVYTLPMFYSYSYIGTITDGTITWARKHLFNGTSIIYDLLDATNNITISTGIIIQNFNTSAINWNLEYGYSLYYKAGTGILRIPLTEGGLVLPNYTPPSGYVLIANIAASAIKHNMADTLIRFPLGTKWDRSNETIYTATARLGYYDATNPSDWHTEELNQLSMHNNFFNSEQDCAFVKATINSCDPEERFGFLELFSTSAKTASALTKVLKYTGDDSFFFNVIMMADPYNEVIKVTAIEDSEFKLKVNNQIYYSKSEVTVKAQEINPDYFPSDINVDGKYFQWMLSSSSTDHNLSFDARLTYLLNFLNSYPAGVCSQHSIFVINFYRQLYETLGTMMNGVIYWPPFDALTSHDIADIPDVGFLDEVLGIMLYKNKYQVASTAEMQGDIKLVSEAIRKTNPITTEYTSEMRLLKYLAMQSYISDFSDPIDNLTMKLPSNSVMVFPIKSETSPICNGDIPMTSYGIANCTFSTGVIGEVKMPFLLIRITGTGIVSLGDTEYTLPDDNAALVAVLQATPDPMTVYRNSFTITANIGGLVAEFLISMKFQLLTKNTYDKGLISGNITIEKDTTLLPMNRHILVVNKGDADKWTFDFNNEFTRNKSMFVPTEGDYVTNYKKVIFAKENMRPQQQWVLTSTSDVVRTVTAGTPVIDQCWAAKLMPRNDDFTISLELSFTPIDESDTYYTLDGTTPDATKTLYTTPFIITETTTVKWINIKTDYANSHINTRVITKTA